MQVVSTALRSHLMAGLWLPGALEMASNYGTSPQESHWQLGRAVGSVRSHWNTNRPDSRQRFVGQTNSCPNWRLGNLGLVAMRCVWSLRSSGSVSIGVAGVERSDPPDVAIPGGSQYLDPSHPNKVQSDPLPITDFSCISCSVSTCLGDCWLPRTKQSRECAANVSR
jgi:hypothetical protein